MDAEIETLVNRVASGELDSSAFIEQLDGVVKGRASQSVKSRTSADHSTDSDVARVQARAERLARRLKAL